MATKNYTADEIAALFAERLPSQGGWISKRQIEWLLLTFARENRIPTPRSATGYFDDGREWYAAQSGNANRAGVLKIALPLNAEELAAASEARDYEERCRIFNNEVVALVQAGDTDALRAHVERWASDPRNKR